MTLFKLSLRNARRQARDYLIYFITVVMSVAFLYAFNNLVFSSELKDLSSMMNNLPLMVVLSSIVVVTIIGWLVSYTTKFMLERRSREFGIYILVGLENRQVARLFFLENLAVGVIALILGMLVGNLIFQALRAITLSLFRMKYYFNFNFSVKAVLLSLLYFTLIYLYALIKSGRTIKKMKIHDLIYLDKKNEVEAIGKGSTRRGVFIASIVAGIIGSVLILTLDMVSSLCGAALIIFFLYGFFSSFTSAVPEYFRRRPQKKYKGNTLLVFRTLSAKLSTTGVVMATISLLFTATLIAEGSGLVFNVLFKSRAEETTCFDVFVSSVNQDKDSLAEYITYITKTAGVRDFLQYPVYLSTGDQVLKYVESTSEYYRMYDVDTLMKSSDYIALRKMLGYPPAEIKPGQYTIHCMSYLGGVMEKYQQPMEISGQTLTPGAVYTENFTQSLWDGNGRGYILIVPDEVAENQQLAHNAYAAMTSTPVAENINHNLRLIRNKRESDKSFDTIFSKAAEQSENAAMCATIVFPLYYLALVLTITATTILTTHQLSETERYRRQFLLLKNLGMDTKEIGCALRKQFVIFYAMPALPPLLIGVPFIVGLGNALDAGIMDGLAILTTVFIALGLFFSIYLIYIIASYSILKRSVLPD